MGFASFLGCHELLGETLNYLQPMGYPEVLIEESPEGHLRRQHRRTLAACALVCRALSECAQDVLWRTLDDMLPLLKILPLYYNAQNTIVLNGIIPSDEWARFRTHAARIRNLDTHPPRRVVVHGSVWSLLAQQNGGRPLLPRLQNLIADKILPGELGSLTPLLAPSLRDIMFSLEESEIGSHLATSMLQTISAAIPQLESFVYTGDHSILPSQLLVLGRLTQLKCLQLNKHILVNEDLLFSISSIKTLESLTVTLKLRDDATSSLPGGFESLRTINITASAKDLLSFVLSVPPHPLDDLYLEFSDKLSVKSTLTTLSSICRHIHKTFTGGIHLDFRKPFLHPPAEIVMLIEPVLSLDIASFDLLYHSQVPSVSDADLLRLASAWPRLTHLNFHHIHRTASPASCPTVSGIFALAARLPKLDTLFLAEFDALSIPSRRAVPPGALAHGLSEFRVQTVRIKPDRNGIHTPHTLRLAAILDAAFPRLEINFSFLAIRERQPESASTVFLGDRTWPAVARFILAMQLGRANARLGRSIKGELGQDETSRGSSFVDASDGFMSDWSEASENFDLTDP